MLGIGIFREENRSDVTGVFGVRGGERGWSVALLSNLTNNVDIIPRCVGEDGVPAQHGERGGVTGG